jgi:hypothetical protein
MKAEDLFRDGFRADQTPNRSSKSAPQPGLLASYISSVPILLSRATSTLTLFNLGAQTV